MPAPTASEVQRKARAFDDKMAAQASNARAERRKIALASIARAGGAEGAEAKRLLAAESAAADRKAKTDDHTAAPRSLAEAKGDARAFARADMRRQASAENGDKPANPGRASMLAEMRKRGLEPAR